MWLLSNRSEREHTPGSASHANLNVAFKPWDFVNVIFKSLLSYWLVICCDDYLIECVIQDVILSEWLADLFFFYKYTILFRYKSTHLWERPSSVSICASLRVPPSCFSCELRSSSQPGRRPSSPCPVHSQSQSLMDRRCWACHCSAHHSPLCSPDLAGSDDRTAENGGHYNQSENLCFLKNTI